MMTKKSKSVVIILAAAVFGWAGNGSDTAARDDSRLIFPRPFGVAIDDMGWNEGGSRGDNGGPWRVGLRRNFDVRDYQAVVEVARAAGVRFQGAFLLAEMDRMNVCAGYPTTTMYGEAFDNTSNIDRSQLEMMAYIQDQAAWLEFGIHGVGHEHWMNGQRRRAEWYNLEDDHAWPEQDMKDHLECFRSIMAQYGWSPENGHSFPESFVPCAYGYYWNPDGRTSTGSLMAECGVRYVNTLFSQIEELNPPSGPNNGGFDHGVLVINRMNYGNEWFETASLPKQPLGDYESDIIETHWANWLATDDFLQPALNQKWIDFFQTIQAHPDHYLAKNTEQLFSQWLYKKYTRVEEKTQGRVVIDNRFMPEEAYRYQLLGNMVLAFSLDEGVHVQKVVLQGKPVIVLLEEAGFGYVYLPPLERDIYELDYETGSERMPVYVDHQGTYNIYDADISGDTLILDLKMYGTQIMKVHCDRPGSVISGQPHLKITAWTYDDASKTVSMEITGRNMQGEQGEIRILF